MKGWQADCRHALRLYARTPAASLIAVAVLAVGMAFVVAFLSLYVDLVLRPHPGFEQSGRLATITRTNGTLTAGLSHGIAERMTDEMTSIEGAALFSNATARVERGEDSRMLAMISAGFFDSIRPRLALGRGFRLEDHAPDAGPVVVLTHRFWQTQFDGDPAVLDTSIEIARVPGQFYIKANGEVDFGAESDPDGDSAQYRIIGVLAEPLSAVPNVNTEMWLPMEQALPLLYAEAGYLPNVTGQTLVRLRDGVSVTAMLNEFNARFPADSLPSAPAGFALDAIEGVFANIAVQRDAQRQLELFLVGSLLVALVAAINVSLFLLARAPGRRRELGIRLAVGATGARIARQLATESGLLVVAAAAAGVLLSVWLATILRGLPVMRQAEWRDVSLLDPRVLGLATACIVVLVLVVSLAPVAGLLRRGIGASSKLATARATPAQRLAVMAQLAIAGIVGSAAVGFGWYVGAMLYGDPGFEVENRYAVRQVGMAMGADADIQLERTRTLLEAIPGVSRAAFGNPVPGGSRPFSSNTLTDDAGREISFHEGRISRAYVELLGLRLVHGRVPDFGESGIVVNQAFANAYWGHEGVVGEALSYFNGDLAVTGVLEDVAYYHPGEPAEPFIFRSIGGSYLQDALVETSLSRADLEQAVNRLITDGTIETVMSGVNAQSLASLRSNWIAADRARGLLTVIAALIIVGLAAFGIYGTQHYLVAAGRRDYAIRSALGAGPAALGRLVLQRGLLLGLPGLVVGGLLGFIALAWLRDEFLSREIEPGLVTLGVMAALVGLLLAASIAPARKAQRTQPALLLRSD